jgi:nucleotide-binding universal stress UspA family protein
LRDNYRKIVRTRAALECAMQPRELMFNKILCPIDFSPGAEHALHVAVRMAIEADAELVLAHVWDLPGPTSMRFPLPADAVQLMMHEQERGLAAASRDACRLGAKRVTTRLLSGVAWEQVVQTLTVDAKFDLVVGLRRVLLGSVAEKIVRHAPCPVLVARIRT